MSSSESSTASPSPPASPSIGTHGAPNLERLVLHFVSAKRALNATQHVERVTHLVTSSRDLIEETAVLSARNAFATGKVYHQIDTLQAINRNITTSESATEQEFSTVIADLDAANDHLHKTLTGLKSIVVDSALQRASSDEPVKTLFDFVDESQYDDISTSIRTLIDSFQASRMDMESSLERLTEQIEEVSALLQMPEHSNSPSVKPTIYDEPLLPVSQAFGTMEEHAGEMANLLQSLISHYDLCVSALKHTEGGREAARNAVLAGATGEDALEESLFGMKLVGDISDQERAEMMTVVEADAEEVDEVKRDGESCWSESEAAASLLQRIRHNLPIYIDAASAFQTTWLSIQSSIDEKMKDIVGFRAFYDEFLSGYKKLLREVDRRRAAEVQMKRLAQKAQEELDVLYNADKLARDEFIEDVASFLPSDLWPGVADPSVRWEVKAEMMELSDDKLGQSS